MPFVLTKYHWGSFDKEQILTHREIVRIRPILQKLCSTGECSLEQYWAKEIIAAPDEHDGTSFCYFHIESSNINIVRSTISQRHALNFPLLLQLQAPYEGGVERHQSLHSFTSREICLPRLWSPSSNLSLHCGTTRWLAVTKIFTHRPDYIGPQY